MSLRKRSEFTCLMLNVSVFLLMLFAFLFFNSLRIVILALIIGAIFLWKYFVYKKNIDYNKKIPSKKYIQNIENSIHQYEGLDGYMRRLEKKGRLYHEGTSFIVNKKFKISGPLLDVGTALGDLIVAWKDYEFLKVGIDVSPHRIADFKKRLEGLNIYAHKIVADAEYLPFKDASFKSVVLSEVLEHLISPELAISEASRVLSEKGDKVILTVPNAINFQRFYMENRICNGKVLRYLFNPFLLFDFLLRFFIPIKRIETFNVNVKYFLEDVVKEGDIERFSYEDYIHRDFTLGELRSLLKNNDFNIEWASTIEAKNLPFLRNIGGMSCLLAVKKR